MSIFQNKKFVFAVILLLVLGSIVYMNAGYRLTPERVFKTYQGAFNENEVRQIRVDEINGHIFAEPQPNHHNNCFVVTVVMKHWIGWKMPKESWNGASLCGREKDLSVGLSADIEVSGSKKYIDFVIGRGEKDKKVTYVWSDGTEIVLRDNNRMFLKWLGKSVDHDKMIISTLDGEVIEVKEY